MEKLEFVGVISFSKCLWESRVLGLEMQMINLLIHPVLIMPRRDFHDDWLHWFPDCPDRRRGPDGQARAEEGPHCPADGQAQVQEEGAEAPRLRQPVWCHRDEGACGLWDQQVGGLNSTITIYQLQLSPCLFSIVFWLYFYLLFFIVIIFFLFRAEPTSLSHISGTNWDSFEGSCSRLFNQPRRPSTPSFQTSEVTSRPSWVLGRLDGCRYLESNKTGCEWMKNVHKLNCAKNGPSCRRSRPGSLRWTQHTDICIQYISALMAA